MKDQPGDKEIRQALKYYISVRHRKSTASFIGEELGVCRGAVRADLAVVNGLLHCYEIKSDRDSLRRLSTQVAVYSDVFDKITIVVGSRYIAGVRKILPRWCGILKVSRQDRTLSVQSIREPQPNTKVKASKLVEFLWRDDALQMLRRVDADRGIRNSHREAIWNRVCEVFSRAAIAREVRKRLKARASMKALQRPMRDGAQSRVVARRPVRQSPRPR